MKVSSKVNKQTNKQTNKQESSRTARIQVNGHDIKQNFINREDF